MFLNDLYNNNKLFENISPIDLAEILFNGLQQKYPEAVTRYGHEVVGDAVIDYAEEADDIHSMSDVDMAVDEILDYLENYQGDRTNDLEPDSSAPVTENLRKWFKEKWVRFGPDGKIRGSCARGDSSEGKPKCLPQAKAHALGKKGRKYAAAKKRREDPNPERHGAAINVATKKKSNEGVAEGLNEFAPDGFGAGDGNDLQLYIDIAKKLNMKKYKPSTAHDLIAKKMAELVDVVDDDKVDYARHMARKAQGLPSMLDQQGVAEGAGNIEVGDKITWWYNKFHPNYEGIVRRVSGNTIDVYAPGSGSMYRLTKQDIRSHEKKGVAEGSDNLNYIGNCTDDDVIEHIFGDVNNFANMVEEHGDEFTVGDLVVKYDPETDVHSFYYKKQGVAEGYDSEELANEVYAEFERIYPNLASRADERTVHAAILDVLNYGSDNDPSALAQDVARAVKRDLQGVAEGSIHSPGATQYSGKPDTYTFSKVQQKHYDTLSSILARNGMKFTHIDARTYPARRSYLAPNRNDPKPFFLTSFIVKSPALEWIKYEGGTAGGGQNLVKINSKKMKLTEFLSLPPKQQDALLQTKPTVAVDTAPIWKVNFQWNTQGGQPIHSSTKTKADSKEKAIVKTIKKFKSRGIIISVTSAEPVESPITENANNLSVQQLAAVSDAALDQAYGYGRSTPGNNFGWQANLQSAAYAKKMIDAGVTDIEAIADAIHKGWNTTALRFVQDPDQFDDTEKLRQAGKLEAKLQQRAKLMKISYAELDNDEQEKDRVVARALLQAIKGQQDVAEASFTAAASMNAANRKQSGGKVAQPDHGFRVGDQVTTKDGKEGQVTFVHGDTVHVKGTNNYYPDRIKHYSAKDLKQSVAEGFNADAYDEEHYYRGHTKDKNGEFQPGPKFDSLGAAQKWRKETPGEHKVTLHRRQQDVAEDSLAEMDKSAPQPGRDGRVSHSTYGSRDKGGSKGPEKEAKPITGKKAKQDALDIMKKQGVAEGTIPVYKEPSQFYAGGKKIYKLFRNAFPNLPEHVANDIYNQTSPGTNEKIINAINQGENPKQVFLNYYSGVSFNFSKDPGTNLTPDQFEKILLNGQWQLRIISVNPADFTEHSRNRMIQRNFGINPDEDPVRIQRQQSRAKGDGTNEPVTIIQTQSGYVLWEGFHRTMSILVLGKNGDDPLKWNKVKLRAWVVTFEKQGVAEGQQTCPECGGPAFSNLILAEKQDACYHKVKSRYKVWPSAYASGALVQCRKKGAANWGNKKKTNEATDAKMSQETVRRIQNYLNKKFGANLDVDGILGDLTVKSIKKYISKSEKKLAPEPDKTTAVQGKKTKTNEAKASPSQDYQKMMNFVQGQRLSGVPPEQQVAVALFKELEKTKAYNKQLGAELQAAGERADIGAEQGEITSKELTKHRGELEKEKVKQQASKAQLQTLAQQLDQLKATPDIDPEATAALERQIADLEQRMQSKQGTGVSADKIAELEKAIAAVQQGETVDAKAIEKLEQQFKDAEEAAKTAQARVSQIKDYTAQIEKLNAEIDNLNSALANSVKPKLDQLDQENEHVYQELEQHDSLINQVVNAVTAPNPNAQNIATMAPKMVRQNPQQAGQAQQAPQGVVETRFYFTPKATDTASLRNDFTMTQDSEGWYITESQGPAVVLEAQRAFGIPKIKQVKLKEVRISDFTGRAGTIGDENATSPIGSLPRKGRKYA